VEVKEHETTLTEISRSGSVCARIRSIFSCFE